MSEINSKKKIYLINKLLVYNEKLENSVSKKTLKTPYQVFRLEKEYIKSNTWTMKQIQSLAKDIDLSVS